MTMRFARTIMAFIVALSVAMLPVAGTAAIAVNTAEMTMPAAAQSADVPMAMDCCPDPAEPCDQGGKCQSMASCTQPSLGIANISVSGLTYSLVAGSPLPVLVDSAAPLRAGSPPFRPPRV
jgi:hypothetical protein